MAFGIHLDDDAMTIVVHGARGLAEDLRDDFFRDVAAILRPRVHHGIDLHEVYRAVGIARDMALSK